MSTTLILGLARWNRLSRKAGVLNHICTPTVMDSLPPAISRHSPHYVLYLLADGAENLHVVHADGLSNLGLFALKGDYDGRPGGGNDGARLEAVFAEEVDVIVVGQYQVGVDAPFPHARLRLL